MFHLILMALQITNIYYQLSDFILYYAINWLLGNKVTKKLE